MMFSAKSMRSFPRSLFFATEANCRWIHDDVFGKVHDALSRVRPKCDPSATRVRHSIHDDVFGKLHDALSRVRPEGDPSEAFDLIKYRDNSCEIKKSATILNPSRPGTLCTARPSVAVCYDYAESFQEASVSASEE
jgi:hypothetical protein